MEKLKSSWKKNDPQKMDHWVEKLFKLILKKFIEENFMSTKKLVCILFDLEVTSYHVENILIYQDWRNYEKI